MRARLDRLWRIAATGFCFAVFALFGISALCLFFPLFRFLSSNEHDLRLRARALVHRGMGWFTRLMVFCGTISYEVRHAERLNRQGLLVVANHPSLIDVVLLLSLLRQPNCVVKASLKKNLFTRGPVRCAGFIANTDGPQLMDACVASVRAGDNLIIFPEGTRSIGHDGILSPMKRGAANIALRGRLALTPVVITVSEPMLGKGLPWYRAPRRRPHFILAVLDDIAPPPLGDDAAEDGEIGGRGHLARALTQALAALFEREIRRRAAPQSRAPEERTASRA
ncbi:MAG: 1-acyl-sn-glycerol-3-phosphate acyltransferase [Azoarcus sp.]|jgi:1-acyl-sn-glycerol-3-phosphate acyltransferase|nr:1-acyl-sn-glycerol-3-phosphate acyltransferase [Azoarcus sp.]